MSLPVVLPGSCCPVTGAAQLAEPCHRNRARGLSASSRIAGGGSRLLLPGRPLLSLGLLQLLLGGSMVALSFGALSLSNSPPIRNSCPFWAGSSVILSGIVGLTTWRRPMLLLSDAGDVCYCCSLSTSSRCPEETLLELHPAHSCSTLRILLKDEPRATVEEREEPAQVPHLDEFVAPAPPPSYFSTFYSYTPRLAHRMLGDSVIPLPHIYGDRIKGVEVLCPLEPPPPYEAVAGSTTEAVTQETEIPMTELTMNPTTSTPGACVQDTSALIGLASPSVLLQAKPKPPQQQPPQQQQQQAPALTPWRTAKIYRSNSDPVLMDLAAKGVY